MKTNRHSYLFDTDSYKPSHYLQYPPGTTSMFDYIESRGNNYDDKYLSEILSVIPDKYKNKYKEQYIAQNSNYNYTVVFGYQYWLREYLSYPVTVEEVEKAKVLFAMHGVPFNYEGWMYIARDLKGKIPVRIRAVPEGTVVPTHNALVTVESTDPKVFWIVSWLETSLLRALWYPTTVATRSHHIKRIIMDALEKTSDDPKGEISFKLHDFGSRGVSSQESAMLGGAAHLVNFMGSDTIVGMMCANEYYDIEMSAFSIPAAEHSSITSWGKENEVEAYRNMLKHFAKPNSLVAVVSDSYDIYNACDKLWGDLLKQEVIDSGATVVIRPDSGYPAEVVLKVAQILDRKFGSKINSKGYKVLNNVRIIQGDGVNEYSIKEILDNLIDAGFSATNIAFGMGGALLQSLNRDTLRWAMKCSSITVDNVMRDVFKDPVTDHGKISKRGRLDLVRWQNGNYGTVNIGSEPKHIYSCMNTVFENGEILVHDTFDKIRNRAAI